MNAPCRIRVKAFVDDQTLVSAGNLHFRILVQLEKCKLAQLHPKSHCCLTHAPTSCNLALRAIKAPQQRQIAGIKDSEWKEKEVVRACLSRFFSILMSHARFIFFRNLM